MKKRMLSLVIIAIMAFLPLSACGSGAENTQTPADATDTPVSDTDSGQQPPPDIADGQTHIIFWEMFGPDREFDLLTNEYNEKHPEVFVEDVYFPGHNPLLQKLQVTAASSSDEAPNVVFYDGINVAVTDQLYPLVDLRTYFEQEPDFKFEDFYPVFQQFGVMGDRVVSLHGWANCLVLYYNKRIFSDNGLDPEKPPASWDEMYEYARVIQDDAAGIWGFLPNYTIDNSPEGFSWEWQSQTVSAGGRIWDEGYNTLLFNDQPAIDALNFYVDAFKEGISTMSPPEKAFNNGFTGMAIAGAWMQNEYTEALGDDLGVTIWPGKERPAPNVGGEHFMIVQTDDEAQQASWEFVKHWFLEPEVHLRVAQSGGTVPTYTKLLDYPAYAEWLDSNPTMTVVSDSMDYAVNRAVRTDYPKFTEIIYKHFEPVYYQQTDAATAVQAAYDELVAEIGG